MHFDPRVSARFYVYNCNDYDLLYHDIMPYSLTFLSNHCRGTEESWIFRKSHTNFASKTNNVRTNLLAVSTSCMKAGFPVG